MFSLEWAHVIFAGAGAVIGTVSGLVAGVWRVARIDQGIRIDFRKDIDASEFRIEEKMDALVGQFQDTFAALRQKINDVELDVVKHYVAKGDFDDFRAEYREDMRDLKNSIAQIPRAH